MKTVKCQGFILKIDFNGIRRMLYDNVSLKCKESKLEY